MKTSFTQGLGASASALLTSSATLLCCVLPAALVSIGAGASLATLVTAFPQLVWLSEHKGLVFGIAGLTLAGSGMLLWNARRLPCPIDPRAALTCNRMRKISHSLFVVAIIAYATGITFAFLLPALNDLR
jgi:hypothetical protein